MGKHLFQLPRAVSKVSLCAASKLFLSYLWTASGLPLGYLWLSLGCLWDVSGMPWAACGLSLVVFLGWSAVNL